ncbi:MAG: ribonuclease III [Roseburia sp.]|nr:ribonuclease III [Roseburia sp.]MCM1098707.1 ribonuclease III [Ruminococcus flavefaciens]
MEQKTVGEELLAKIREVFPGKKQDIRSYSPLTLAYIGDAVFDLMIRTAVVEQANRPANDLHHIAVKYVNAGAQARMIAALADRLTEEERAVYHRGKNAKPHTMAKNASAGDYRRATGFEALVGWLYLQGDLDRILELVKEGIAAAGLEL